MGIGNIKFRFANILKLCNISEYDVWKVVKEIKSKTLFDKRCYDGTCLYGYMDYNGLYFDITAMTSQVAALEEQLKVNSSELRLENMTNKDLKAAAEMFIYLNSCPGVIPNANKVFVDEGVKNDDSTEKNINELWFKSWYFFYKDLIENNSPSQIILTFNRLSKINAPKNSQAKIRHQKLLEKSATLLNLQYKNSKHIAGDKWKRKKYFYTGKQILAYKG